MCCTWMQAAQEPSRELEGPGAEARHRKHIEPAEDVECFLLAKRDLAKHLQERRDDRGGGSTGNPLATFL